MARVLFTSGTQEKWFKQLLDVKEVATADVARLCNVTTRTIRYWQEGKYKPDKLAVLGVHKTFGIPLPKDIRYLPDFWYVHKGARKGALRRLALYGPPGNIESRRKGGRISQLHRRLYPERYRQLGCIVRKNYPNIQKSEALTELIGVLIGDGGITNYQVRITLSRDTDRAYATFIKKLVTQVVGETPAWYEYRRDNTIVLCLSGAEIVRKLVKLGLVKGNKIRQNVDIPRWVWKNQEYQKACLRGLIDTDGGVYFHRHTTNGIRYRNLGLCFASGSKQLIRSASKILKNFEIKHSVSGRRIFLYDLGEVKRYFLIIGSSNPKHNKRLQLHLSKPRRIS